jgi:anti-sigma factor RsiW
MECQHASALMSQRLDSQLTDTEVAALEEHLSACVCCQAEWETLQALDALFAMPAVVPAPAHFKGLVMERIRRRDQAKRAITGGIVLMLGVVAVVGLLAAPLLVHTLNIQSVLPVLVAGGPETAGQLISYLASLSRTALVLVEQFAAPLCLLAAAFITAALVLNCMLFGVLRRVHVRQ